MIFINSCLKIHPLNSLILYVHLFSWLYVGCNHNNFKSKMQQESDFLGMVTF